MRKLALLVSTLLISTALQAQTISLAGPVTSSGNGCPQNQAQVVFSPSMSAFSVLYGQMSAESSVATDVSVNCNLEIPIRLPKGKRMRLVKVDHRGFINLNSGDAAQLSSRFLWIGGGVCTKFCMPPAPVELKKQYLGPVQSDFTETMVSGNWNQKSGCGGDRVLRVQNTINIANRSGQQSILTLDSQDGTFAPESVYYVQFESCI